jgi:hypothetical protein
MIDEDIIPVEDRGDVVTPAAPPPADPAPPITDNLDPDAETPEEKAEREREEAEAAKSKAVRIPKHRVDEMRAKDAAAAKAREDRLLEEIQKLKAGQQTVSTQENIQKYRTEIDTLEEQYETAIANGKIDEAKAIRKRLAPLRDDLLEVQTSIKANAARSAAVEELTYNAQVTALEAAHPVLNPDHVDGDPVKIEEVADMMKAFIAVGRGRIEALNKAVQYVLGEPKAAAVAPENKRAAEARARAAAADKQQPASLGNVGANSDRHGKDPAVTDVIRMTHKQFDSLPEEALARLRGDIL